MIGIWIIRRLIYVFRSNATPAQIASGFVLGMVLGLISLKSLFSVPVILLIILLNVNIPMAVAGSGLFRLITWGVDPWIHSLGYWLLVDLKSFEGIWTYLYNIPIFPYTRFNNTIVMGSLTVSIVLIAPVYISMKKFVVFYRDKLSEKINRWKIVKILKSTKLFELIGKISRIGA